jgi:hypothetical protein
MLKRAAALAALLALSNAAWGLQQPPQAPPPPEDEKPVTFTVKPPSARSKTPTLRIDGTAPFPDLASLHLTVYLVNERWGIGNSVVPGYKQAWTGLVTVSAGKFSVEALIPGPGMYMVQADLKDAYQRKTVLDQIKGRFKTRRWQSTFTAWGDDLMERLSAKLVELDQFSADALDLINKYERACATKQGFEAEQRQLAKDGGALLTKFERNDSAVLYSAAFSQIHTTIQQLQACAVYFNWTGGSMKATSYHANFEEIKTFRQEEFNFKNLKRYIQDSIVVAGREMGLWIVKDLKRTNGQYRPEIMDILKANTQHQGLTEFADRLGKLTPADLDAMEKEIRGIREAEKKPAEEPPKDAPKPAEPGKPAAPPKAPGK